MPQLRADRLDERLGSAARRSRCGTNGGSPQSWPAVLNRSGGAPIDAPSASCVLPVPGVEAFGVRRRPACRRCGAVAPTPLPAGGPGTTGPRRGTRPRRARPRPPPAPARVAGVAVVVRPSTASRIRAAPPARRRWPTARAPRPLRAPRLESRSAPAGPAPQTPIQRRALQAPDPRDRSIGSASRRTALGGEIIDLTRSPGPHRSPGGAGSLPPGAGVIGAGLRVAGRDSAHRAG